MSGQRLELGAVAGSLTGPDDELFDVAETEGKERRGLAVGGVRGPLGHEAATGHPAFGPSVARRLNQGLEPLGGEKGAAAYGELLRCPLAILTPDDPGCRAAIAA